MIVGASPRFLGRNGASHRVGGDLADVACDADALTMTWRRRVKMTVLWLCARIFEKSPSKLFVPTKTFDSAHRNNYWNMDRSPGGSRIIQSTPNQVHLVRYGSGLGFNGSQARNVVWLRANVAPQASASPLGNDEIDQRTCSKHLGTVVWIRQTCLEVQPESGVVFAVFPSHS